MSIIDRGEVQHPGARRHKGAVCCEGEFAQEVAVQSTNDRATFAVSDLSACASAGITHEDLAAAFVAESNRDDFDAGFGGGLGCVDSKGVVVFAIRDQDQRSLSRARSAKAYDCSTNGFSQLRATSRHAMRARFIKCQAKKALVRRHRREDARAPCEGDQPNMVVAEIPKKVPYLRLGPFESIWFRVVGEHRTRHIDRDHDLCPDPRCRDEAFAHLRLHRGDRHREPRYAEKHITQRTAPL